MERTQRLLGIALAVIMLDGCRSGAEHVTNPNATGTPSPRGSSSYHGSSGHMWTHFHHIGTAAAAGAFAHGARGHGGRGGFGGAGAHGSGS